MQMTEGMKAAQGPQPGGNLLAVTSRKPASNRCVHHRYARNDTVGDPVAACAATTSGDTFGVLIDEGLTGSFGCAVEAANEAARLNGRYDIPGDPFFTWALLCAEHHEQPAGDCAACAADGTGGEPVGGGEKNGPDTGVPGAQFVSGRAVSADGATRTVADTGPVNSGAPAAHTHRTGEVMTPTPDAPAPLVRVTQYTVTSLPEDLPEAFAFDITVEYRGCGRWAVKWSGMCLGTDGEWEREPRPSEREEDWLAAHRFDEQTALRLARQAVPHLMVNGCTAADLVRLHAQRQDRNRP
ncbi:hypothetical protein [Streptomyces luteireticuli]|uniref:hypothetical protein n=1 Tax=Streptomyces luteireticuli TaxID=173858 RepID=UPI003555FFDB